MPQLMQQFSFMEMIWYHRMSLTLSLSVRVTNGQKWLTNRVFQIVPQPHLENATLFSFCNINVLLRILCTLPVTSAKCERSFSTLKRLKTYLRSTLTTERQSGLAMMNINYGRAIDIDEIINIFATHHPCHLVLKDILTDKQSEYNRVF